MKISPLFYCWSSCSTSSSCTPYKNVCWWVSKKRLCYVNCRWERYLDSLSPEPSFGICHGGIRKKLTCSYPRGAQVCQPSSGRAGCRRFLDWGRIGEKSLPRGNSKIWRNSAQILSEQRGGREAPGPSGSSDLWSDEVRGNSSAKCHYRGEQFSFVMLWQGKQVSYWDM